MDKICKRCGTSERYANGRCKQCRKEDSRKYHHANPDKQKAKKRRYLDANAQKVRESDRRYRQANPDRAKERQRRWRVVHQKEHRERVRKYNQENPERRRAADNRRRARLRGNGGSYTAAEWRAIVEAQDGRCLSCGEKKTLTVDHVIPLDKGGRNDASNIQGLCKTCNNKKFTKVIDYRPHPGLLRWVQKKLFG